MISKAEFKEIVRQALKDIKDHQYFEMTTHEFLVVDKKPY